VAPERERRLRVRRDRPHRGRAPLNLCARIVKRPREGSPSRFTLDSEIPFGGYKASGIGRQNGMEGLDAFIELKTVHLTREQATVLGYR
jgi:hypothetical protein